MATNSESMTLTPSPADLLPLQLWLAKQLPQEIEIRDEPQGKVSSFYKDEHRFDSSWSIVTPREWDYIVRRVEGKLMKEQQGNYVNEIIDLLEIEFGDCGFERAKFLITTAPWPTRTIALMKVKGEKE